MGSIIKHPPVKLFFGFIFKDDNIYSQTRLTLEKHFGKIDFESNALPFIYTDYYQKELGRDLKRRFVSVGQLINPADLYKIKIYTNKIEKRLSKNGCRLINIDPGYLDLAKLALASTKDYCHRIYLNKGIFAEITLVFQGKTFKPLGWAYPDYRSEDYISIFNEMREIYKKDAPGLSKIIPRR
jgi:hypothetical protein